MKKHSTFDTLHILLWPPKYFLYKMMDKDTKIAQDII